MTLGRGQRYDPDIKAWAFNRYVEASGWISATQMQDELEEEFNVRPHIRSIQGWYRAFKPLMLRSSKAANYNAQLVQVLEDIAQSLRIISEREDR